MNKRYSSGMAILFLAFGLVACSGPMVNIRYDHSQAFETIKSFAWVSQTNGAPSAHAKNPDLDRRIRSAIETTLQAKGLHSVPEQEANVFLDYRVSKTEEASATHVNDYATAEFMGLTDTLGRLDLVMRRPSSPAVIWQGSAQATIDMTWPPEKWNAKVEEVVHALLKKFPPTR
jgi:hypothetical protein